MSEVLRLEPPFYRVDAVEHFVRPFVPSSGVVKISVNDLNRPEICEALNQALRFSIERAT
jgi:hypothetical protein